MKRYRHNLLANINPVDPWKLDRGKRFSSIASSYQPLGVSKQRCAN